MTALEDFDVFTEDNGASDLRARQEVQLQQLEVPLEGLQLFYGPILYIYNMDL